MSDAPPDLAGLYRTAVLDHSRRPRNFRRAATANRQATGHNPLCGDKLTLYLEVGGDGIIRDAAFEATGCAISVASASMLSEQVPGRTTAGALELAARVGGMFAHPPGPAPAGELAALAGVRDYPSRVRCATLPWRTLEAALRGENAEATTEPKD
jgi:nitrogen fixation NifU-like protein